MADLLSNIGAQPLGEIISVRILTPCKVSLRTTWNIKSHIFIISEALPEMCLRGEVHNHKLIMWYSSLIIIYLFHFSHVILHLWSSRQAHMAPSHFMVTQKPCEIRSSETETGSRSLREFHGRAVIWTKYNSLVLSHGFFRGTASHWLHMLGSFPL